MPLTLVQRQQNQSAAAVASLTATFSPAPTAGNLLVVNADSDATLTMTSSGFTLAVSSVHDTGLYQWYKIAGASEPAPVTITPGSSASTEMVIEEWSGNVSSSPLDKTATSSATTGANAIPSGTTATLAQADELVVAGFGFNDAGGSTTANTYTNSYTEVAETKGLGGLATNVAVAELAVSATTATSTTVTLSRAPASVKGGLIGTYKAAAGGSTPTSGSDTGTGTDAQSSLSVTAPGSETSTGTDSGSATVTLSSSDSGTGTDVQVSIVSPVTGSDSATGTDAGTVGVTASGTDSGTGTDTGSVFRPLSDSESSAGTDAGTVSAAIPGSDTGAGTDSGTASTSGSSSDTGSGSEGGTASVTLSGSDSATGTDAGTVDDLSGGTIPVGGSDSGTGTDSGAVLDLTPPPVVPVGDDELGDISTEDVRFKTGHDSGLASEFGVVVDLTPRLSPFAFLRKPKPAFKAVYGSDGGVGAETALVDAVVAGREAGAWTEREKDLFDETAEAEDETFVLGLLGVNLSAS